MVTRCKFRCNDVQDHGNGKRSVSMSPVYSDDPKSENKAFWDATPGGDFRMYWINDKVNFEPGKQYYLDITPAD